MTYTYRLIFTASVLALLFSASDSLYAQKELLRIQDVLEKVGSQLPQLKAFKEQADAASAQIALAKNELIPEINAGYQINLATYNNITGMSYPGFLLPISGPPSVNNNVDFVSGSAIGAILKWSPITFGQNKAMVEKATATYKLANARYEEQLFRNQYTAIEIYLRAWYYKSVLKSLEADTARLSVGLQQALVLAKTGLRPGIDTAQFQSAMAQAVINLLQIQNSYEQQLIELTRLTGINTPVSQIELSLQPDHSPVLTDTVTEAFINTHPSYVALLRNKDLTTAALNEINKSWRPQLDFWGNAYARGSGIDAGGNVNKWSGLGFSRTNFGVGVQLSFPVLQFNKVNIRKKQYQSLIRADENQLQQSKLDIEKQTSAALHQYHNDLKIADQMPILLRSAKNVYEGLLKSYEAGLIDFARLTQGQYDLLKAEINKVNTSLQLWKSLLNVAIAMGKLELFADQLK